ncbi:phosphatase PAP2 family protein [Polaromonas sp.]|uniref:phosphatase PAP2 family protein n=1 Tax=Polaromonas sp. TaxID=1869339 RepID=UPI002488D66F|nr:phosphatase PAP2 family protein [Polaromonas sp.]MDI1273581.1 phosphatase PAP2 family protein [Polaromonas sp.]
MPFTLPTPLDKPDRLAEWAAGPRMAACSLEMLSGLRFDVNQAKAAVTLGFVNLDKKPLKDLALARLVRPGEKIFTQQLDLVANYAELRKDRGAEVLAQMNGGAAFWASIVGLTAHRHKYTLELLDLAMSLATHVEMRFKHAFACPRPVDLSPQIQPMIPTPGHASWPSGHATEAYMTCAFLQALIPHGDKYSEQLERLAARIAVNRTVAGLHYPVDSAVGRLLGTSLAEFFVARCTGQKVHERGFAGPKFHGPKDTVIDFDPRISMTDNKSGYYEYASSSSAIAASPLLEFMWTKAAKEWQPLK